MPTDHTSEEAITRRQKALAEIRPTPADLTYDAARATDSASLAQE